MPSLQTENERLWRPEQVAERCQISRTRVYELIKAGDLHSVRIGGSRRISESAVQDFFAGLAS